MQEKCGFFSRRVVRRRNAGGGGGSAANAESYIIDNAGMAFSDPFLRFIAINGLESYPPAAFLERLGRRGWSAS
jgi:hypothetical protein